MSAGHPRVRQSKQRKHLRCTLREPVETRLGLLDLALGFVQRAAFIQLLVRLRRASICQITSLSSCPGCFSTPVYPRRHRISFHCRAVVCRPGYRLRRLLSAKPVDVNAGLHPEVVRIAFRSDAFPSGARHPFVLGRTRRIDQDGIADGALAQPRAAVA